MQRNQHVKRDKSKYDCSEEMRIKVARFIMQTCQAPEHPGIVRGRREIPGKDEVVVLSPFGYLIPC